MRLILARHGETLWNREHRVLGHTEIELSDLGRRQAERLALALKEERVAAIYSSPLRRARETAEAIARIHQLGVEFDEALKELDTGELDGLTFVEMGKHYSEFLKRWIEDASSVSLPGGESIRQLRERVWPMIERIAESHPNDVVIVVSHSFVIQCIICKALGISLSHYRRLRLNVGSISILEFGQRGISLLLFNDTCHLEGEPG